MCFQVRDEAWMLWETTASGTHFALMLMGLNMVELQPHRSTAGMGWCLDQGPETSLLRASRGLAAEAFPCTSPGWWPLFLPGQQHSWGGQEAFLRGGPR